VFRSFFCSIHLRMFLLVGRYLKIFT
jgi:hypothetical protein